MTMIERAKSASIPTWLDIRLVLLSRPPADNTASGQVAVLGANAPAKCEEKKAP